MGRVEDHGLERVQGPEVLALRVIPAYGLFATPSSLPEALSSGLFGRARYSFIIDFSRNEEIRCII